MTTLRFLRAVATPKRGIGHQTLAVLGTFAGARKISLFEALFTRQPGDGDEPAPVARAA